MDDIWLGGPVGIWYWTFDVRTSAGTTCGSGRIRETLILPPVEEVLLPVN